MALPEKFLKDPAWPYLRQSEAKLLTAQHLTSGKKFDPKKSVWIPDPEEGFIAAEIKSTTASLSKNGTEMITVLISDKGIERKLSKEEVQPRNPPKFEMSEDMAELTHLNEASVLHNLRQRYANSMIYTYSGLFCVAINPYKRLPIYSESVCKMYIGRRRNEMPPHIFSICDEAYRNMMNEQENQSMLITGESGAGKTENTKKVIGYFAVVGGPSGGSRRRSSSSKDTATLEEQVVRTNPVLEAFGNAKTIRNNNSSRFGKFIRIHFNKAGRLTGGDIEHYLLEKSRVIKQLAGERSYHIFYQIMSDAIIGLKKKLYLNRPISDYHFVAQAEVAIDGLDDREEMLITDESFDIMKFADKEKFEMYALVAAVMHMGEMRFKQRLREEQAEAEDIKEGEISCKLFGVDKDAFLTAILRPRVKIGAEWVNKGQNLEQVNFSVGALAKALYSRMFAWLIRRCNATLDIRDKQQREGQHFIGVLDIAGFEIFELNSFEQLWINFVNERLQQFFNHHMFILEQEEYQREGIQWTFIDFGLDLQPCIELIEKPLGIISMLDEECIVPKATDSTFVQKLNDQHMGKHANYQRPKPPKGKQVEAHFAVIHYAGTVQYNAQSWLEKNKDPLNDSVVAVLKSNPGMTLLKNIWEDYQTQEDEKKEEQLLSNGGSSRYSTSSRTAVKSKKGKSSTFQTVSMIYRQSLANLIKMLNQTHPHFIRCIIPNEQKKAGVIDAGLVLNQLTCNGVLEGIRICRKGFPNRVHYLDFRQRYAVLAAKEAIEPVNVETAGRRMCERMEREGILNSDSFQCGKTKVFFKTGVLASLEQHRDEALAKIIAEFQRVCRYYLAQKELQRRRAQQAGIKIIQRNVRKWCALRGWNWFKLLGRVRPLIKENQQRDDSFAELENIHKKYSRLEADFAREEKRRKELEADAERLKLERQQLEMALARENDRFIEAETHAKKADGQKVELERQLDQMSEQLGEQESDYASMAKARKKLEADVELLRKQLSEADSSLRKQESDRQAREAQTRSLQDEIASLDETVAKLGKERKHQEELNRKLSDEVNSYEERIAQLNRAKQKLEQTLDQSEETLERERKARQDLDKQKRKTEGELKIAQENLEELGRQREELENAVKRKEAETQLLTSRLEEEQSLVSRLQKQIKELVSRVQELEDELDSERSARIRAEKSRSELQVENDELTERLDEMGGAGAAQIELNKRREAEISRMRREMEESTIQNDAALQALKKKNADVTVSLSEQLEAVQKARSKAEKDRIQMEREIEQLQQQLDAETKQRQNDDRTAKHWEAEAIEWQAKAENQNRLVTELQSFKSRAQTDVAELNKQLEEAEEKIAQLGRAKIKLASQLEESQRLLEQENRERLEIMQQLSNSRLQCDKLREQVEEEQESKSDLLRQISKANAETQQWRAKYEGEGLLRAEELEEQRRKILAKSEEVIEQLEQAQQRIVSLEKFKHRQAQELDDAQLQSERATQALTQIEKKHKGVDKLLDDWRLKCDSLAAEAEAAERQTRIAGTEVLRLRNLLEESEEKVEGLRRENKSLVEELRELSSQVNEGSRGEHELAKAKRRLELEKEELQLALESAESALEAEENKVLRAQVEISQIRSEIEKRIAEKEEEFENTRKTHQHAIDSIQATLEAESRARSDLVKTKKKLESDIGEMEISLDHANRANYESQKHLKKQQEQIRELQQQIDSEQQQRDILYEQAQTAERRSHQLAQEKEEAIIALEQTEKARRQLDIDSQEMREALLALEQQTISLSAQKRKLEADLLLAQSDLNEMGNELRACDERAKRAISDAARLAEELRQEQDHAQHIERQRKALELQIKDLHQRVDEAELLAMKGGKKAFVKLEQRVHELTTELEAEARRHTETQKALRGKERRVRELQFQVDEDKKGQERLYQLVERLQQKLKTFKRQNEEAEQIASMNLNKYRHIQYQLEDAEERADIAENSLAKYRAKCRSTANIQSLIGKGVKTSASTASALHNNVHYYPIRHSSVEHTSSVQNTSYGNGNPLWTASSALYAVNGERQENNKEDSEKESIISNSNQEED